MESIRTDHDLQNRTIQGQKIALDNIVAELASLRFLGKDKDVSHLASPAMTPTVDSNMDFGNAEGGSLESSAGLSAVTNDIVEIGEIDEKVLGRAEQVPPKATPLPPLNPGAKPFYPNRKRDKEDDIEMGEVSEDPKDMKGKRRLREELEEGEASDLSSELSDPPDD